MYKVKRGFSMTPEKMTEIYVWLAADPLGGQKPGGYGDAPGVEVKAHKNTYSSKTQEQLWDACRLFTGVSE